MGRRSPTSLKITIQTPWWLKERMVRKAMLYILDALTRPIRVFVLRIGVRLFPRTGAHGFDVVDWAGVGPALPELVERLSDALQLIQEREPRRYRRLSKDIRRFLITRITGAEYFHTIRACMLSPQYLRKASTEQIAATIVHEGTHARLSSRGIKYKPALRERIERTCVREEITFAARLPNGADLIVAANEKLDQPWWTEEQELERRLRQLEQLGRPRWYRRLYALVWNPR